MPPIKIEDLAKIKERVRGRFVLKEGNARAKITVHMGTCGIAAGAQEVMNALLEEVQKAGVQDVVLTTSGCAGLCSREPMATVEIRDRLPVKYISLNGKKIRRIFDEHVQQGRPVEEYALVTGNEFTC